MYQREPVLGEGAKGLWRLRVQIHSKPKRSLRPFGEGFWVVASTSLDATLAKVKVVKTVLLANGHFAGVTPAIFVIFVDFRGLRSKIPCFGGQNAISEFSPIFVKTTCFRQETKRPFSKTTVSTTLKKCNPNDLSNQIAKPPGLGTPGFS